MSPGTNTKDTSIVYAQCEKAALIFPTKAKRDEASFDRGRTRERPLARSLSGLAEWREPGLAGSRLTVTIVRPGRRLCLRISNGPQAIHSFPEASEGRGVGRPFKRDRESLASSPSSLSAAASLTRSTQSGRSSSNHPRHSSDQTLNLR